MAELLPEGVDRLGMVARWKPVHLGHAAVLRALAGYAGQVTIGIGSSNRYDKANPFTPAETAEMIGLVLQDCDNYRLVEVPDLGDGPRWRAMVAELFGPLDLFVTANPYVRSLMAERYRVVHPVHFVAPDERVAVDGTMVRRAMAGGDDWQRLVPAAVADYLGSRGLVERLRREFAAAILEERP
jgi:nicotinamide-nucleotide adenylyltransferase